MKCWVCDGLGVTYKSKSRLSAYAVRKETCTRCNGTGEIQTNEEWFCNLSTEEKARFLTRIYFDRFINSVLGKNDLVNRLLGLRCYDKAKAEKYITDWLKEVHRESE